MQSETTETPRTTRNPANRHTPPSSHHGYSSQLASPSSSWSDGHGALHESGSEWSLSTSPSPSDYDTWLGPGDALIHRSDSIDSHISFFSLGVKDPQNPIKGQEPRSTQDQSYLLACPHEILLQMLSHLPATDLLTVKLVSRRLYSLVNSPHAWISAFSKYFPGPATIKVVNKNFSGAYDNDDRMITEKRSFTRLFAVPSWTGEYLLRTKLLRCLERGRPSLPFAAPSQGKSHKGFATFSFSSRLAVISNLEAKFGAVQEKRLPQFIHGSNINGAVSISDRRGELSGWGLTQSAAIFRSFEQSHPGSSPWGLGHGDIVGGSNVMDVSTNHGMVYGECTPGGYAYHLPANDKSGKFLSPFLGISDFNQQIPRITQDLQSTCSVWIAKTTSIPRSTRGLIGILTGSSSGVVSAYSIGTPGGREQRMEKGELTARWLLSPGVPIISILADDQFSVDRYRSGSIWAFAVNALGEVFALSAIPQRSAIIDGPAERFETNHEIRAWKTGHTSNWTLIPRTQRKHKAFINEDMVKPSYLPHCVTESTLVTFDEVKSEMRTMQTWISKTPIDFRAAFDGWDMQRTCQADFAGDDGIGGGQSIVVINCGRDEDDLHSAYIKRYTSCGYQQYLSSSLATITPATSMKVSNVEWRCSNLVFGRAKNYQITAAALDCSNFAVTTAAEDVALKHARTNEDLLAKQTAMSLDSDKHSPFKIPGQRARFITVGTRTGQIFVWDIRAPTPSSVSLENDVFPVRFIQTDSSEISCLAVSALYLVHGGTEGLVQAWDPLGSTLGPIRTICSALTRRALLMAQQVPNTLQQRQQQISAVGALCLDPDPTVLRGIVALRGKFRIWGYSSSTASKASPKSQKRKLHRTARGLNSSPADGFMSGRRTGLKSLVDQELMARGVDAEQQRLEAKERSRVAGRFGLDLLGEDVDEETMLAYAKLLSEEDQEQKLLRDAGSRLPPDATESEVEEHMSKLTEEELEQFKYASWPQRFEMSTSGTNSVAHPSTPSSRARATSDSDDIARAIELSMRKTSSGVHASPESSSRSRDLAADDMAEGIRRSLEPESRSSTRSEWRPSNLSEEDELERAIRLSLQDAENASSSPVMRHRQDSASTDTVDESDFPALGSSPRSSPPSSGGGGAWSSKGKRRAW